MAAAPARDARSRGAEFECRGLAVSYGDRRAFEGVSLDIRPGCITGLIGPSGCGKTSFLSCLNRLTDLIPGCAVTGTLRLCGEDVLAPGLDVTALRRRVGMIFQKPNPFPMSIRRNLELPLREHGLRNRSALARRVEGALRDVGLWHEVRDRLDAPAQGLSGGQQQRLCIARALALEPDALLMDEPCGALDPISSAVVEDLILSLRRRFTLVVVTHDLPQARRMADDLAVFWMRDGCGRVVEHGPAQQVFEAPSDPIASAYVRSFRS